MQILNAYNCITREVLFSWFQEKENSVTEIKHLLRYKYPACFLDKPPTQFTFISM